MKKLSLNFSILLLALFASVQSVLGQDPGTKKLDVDIDVDKGADAGNFFMQPWVWIVAGAIFILLLVALMRGSGNKNA